MHSNVQTFPILCTCRIAGRQGQATKKEIPPHAFKKSKIKASQGLDLAFPGGHINSFFSEMDRTQYILFAREVRKVNFLLRIPVRTKKEDAFLFAIEYNSRSMNDNKEQKTIRRIVVVCVFCVLNARLAPP